MRLFVAVYPPAAVRDHLAELVAALAVGAPAAPGRSLRLAPPEQWHLTLAFLGEVPDQRCAEAEAAVAEAVAPTQAAPAVLAPSPGAGRPPREAPLRLGLAGGGRFGRGRFTVLWAGVRGDVDRLQALAAGVRRRLRAARLPYDPKPLRPHLTLARPGDRLPPEALAADLARLAGYAGPEWTVDEVYLVRSHLGPRPEYRTVGRWAFPTAPA